MRVGLGLAAGRLTAGMAGRDGRIGEQIGGATRNERMHRSKQRAAVGVRAAGLALGAMASLLGGCYIASSGSTHRLTQPPVLVEPSVWPKLPARELNEALWAYPDLQPLTPVTNDKVPQGPRGGEVGTAMGLGMRSTSARSPTASLRLHRHRDVIVKLNVGEEGRPADSPPDLMALFIGFTPNGYAQTGLTFGTTRERLSGLIQERERLNALMSSSFVNRLPQPFCAPAVIVEERSGYGAGIPFRFPSTIPAKPRGVILHLWALGANPYERQVMDEFSRRGWIIVDIDLDDGIDRDIDEETVEKVLAIEDRKAELAKLVPPIQMDRPLAEQWEARRNDPAQREIDDLTIQSFAMRTPPVRLRDEADVEPVARMLATEIDRTLARNALATEAILDALHSTYRETRTLPTVVIGFSAGALSTPAVVARLRERGLDTVAATVLIGGAANLVEVAARSTFYDGGVMLESRPLNPGEKARRMERSNRPSAELVGKLGKRYLELCQLDPYHTAAALRGMPVLQVHAIWDTWVPADLGDLLYERLGKPDQLWHTGGHGMLFYFLPGQAAWIADWVERKAPPPPALGRESKGLASH
ncbi:MAG: alpha/beta hydrolase [Tepidisphaera sp.]